MNDTRCWQRWDKSKNKMSYALTTSPAMNLPWHAVRKARELELKYLRDLGVFEKVDEKEAVAKYGITPRRSPVQIRSRMCAREFKSDDRPDLYAGTPPLEALKAIISIAANKKCVTCVFPRKGPETRADTATSGRQNGHRRGESRTDEEEHVRNEGRGQQSGTSLARARQELGLPTGTQLKESFSPQRGPSVGFDTR